MIYVTKHITAKDKDRKARLQQLQQKKDNDNSILEKLDQLKGVAERLQVNKQAEKVIFERNPIGSKINSFMNELKSNTTSKSNEERDFYGRKRKTSNSKRDFYGRKITKGA